MEFKAYFKNEIVPSFFVSVTCISLVMAIVGSVFQPDVELGYGILFSPIIYGIVAAFIQLVGYSKTELTSGQAVIRKIFHVVLLEMGILFILYKGKALTSLQMTVVMVLAILLIYFAVTLVLWLKDKQTSEMVNHALKKLKHNLNDSKYKG